MITRFATLTSRLLVALTVMFTIAACGGGGGGNGGFIPDDGSGGVTYNITLSITDAEGNPTDTVTATSPVTVTVVVTRKGNGQPVAEIVVTGITDLGTLLPASGTALTNANGVAEFQIAAGDVLGAGTITVSVENPSDGAAAFTAEISYQVGQAGLLLGHFNGSNFIDGVIGVISEQVAVGGSAVLRMAVVDENGELASTVETISLKSGCALSGLAILPATVETVNGQAQATYTASGCGGEDEVTAVLQSNGAVATTTLSVAPPEADVIEFVSVVPDTSIIALKGTGTANRPETATLTFRVLTGEATEEDPGTPLPGIPVNFFISTDVGGITLQTPSGNTDANGEVKAIVQSGNIATSVTVSAVIQTADGEGASTASPAIVVSTGLPEQRSISLSASHLNVQGALDFDLKGSILTITAADKFQNPVANGTAAVFTTEYGTVDASCQTGVSNGARVATAGAGVAAVPDPPVEGTCSVLWTSGNPRFPANNPDLVQTIFSNDYNCPSHNGTGGQGIPCPDDLGAIRGLRSTVLATLQGEEWFNDENGNGVNDANEDFENQPEAFVDDNEDRVHTPTVGPQCPNPPSSAARCEAAGSEEPFIDNNRDFMYSLNDDPAVYNGSLCPLEGDGVWCSRDLIDVRDDIVLVMSAQEDFYIVLVNTRTQRIVTKVDAGDSYMAYISDIYNNSPAAEVEVAVSGCGLDTTANPPNSNKRGAFGLPFTVPVDGTDGTFTITAGAASKTYFCEFPEPDPLVPGP